MATTIVRGATEQVSLVGITVPIGSQRDPTEQCAVVPIRTGIGKAAADWRVANEALVQVLGLRVVRQCRPDNGASNKRSNRSSNAHRIRPCFLLVLQNVQRSPIFPISPLQRPSFGQCSQGNLQPKRPHQEHRHLGSRHRVVGAVVAIATAGRDALGGQRFDPVDRPVPEVDITKDAGCGRR